MDRSIQAVQEKILDPFAAELIRRQADVVDDDQRHRHGSRPVTEVGRRQPFRARQPAIR
jgi:hypothetical protein